MDERITKFLLKHHVLTIATCIDNESWCANCFYAYIEEEDCFVFTTDDDTRHGKEFEKNPDVSGSVVLETSVIGKIQGIQFQGVVSRPEGDRYKKAKSAYLKRFPFAVFMDTSLWVVKLNYVKLTDNRLGFGKKLVWRPESVERGVREEEL